MICTAHPCGSFLRTSLWQSGLAIIILLSQVGKWRQKGVKDTPPAGQRSVVLLPTLHTNQVYVTAGARGHWF